MSLEKAEKNEYRLIGKCRRSVCSVVVVAVLQRLNGGRTEIPLGVNKSVAERVGNPKRPPRVLMPATVDSDARLLYHARELVGPERRRLP